MAPSILSVGQRSFGFFFSKNSFFLIPPPIPYSILEYMRHLKSEDILATPAEENIMESYCGDGNISNGLGRNAVRNRLCVLLIGRGGGSRREQRPPPDYPHRL